MQWPNHSLSELFTYLAHRVPERQLPNDPRIHAHCVLVCEGVCIVSKVMAALVVQSPAAIRDRRKKVFGSSPVREEKERTRPSPGH